MTSFGLTDDSSPTVRDELII